MAGTGLQYAVGAMEDSCRRLHRDQRLLHFVEYKGEIITCNRK